MRRRMKTQAGVLALSLVLLASCRPSNDAKGLNSLREIKIERRTILRLGEKMPPAADFCNWTGATCSLRPGTFGGAERMSLTKTDSGLIAQFTFHYGVISAEAVNSQIDEYTRSLGRPSRDSTSKSGEVEERELEWSDSATTFDLCYKTDQNQTEAKATLLDNALAQHRR